MKLYHYSEIDKPQIVISPNKFGENSYSDNDVNASRVPRSFYYVNPRDKETFFTSANLYVAEIPDNQIYNLITDPAGLKTKGYDVDKLLKVIRKSYSGAIYNVGFKIVIMFVPLKVTRVQTGRRRQVAILKSILEELVKD